MAYARALGGRWIILSARYGFIEPGEEIIDYDEAMTAPAVTPKLVEQARLLGLARHREVILLGGFRYRETARLVLQELGTEARISEPFKSMGIGKQMKALKEFVSKTQLASEED